MAEARFRDARALREARRYDATVYLCGYAIELALKARICETLGWAEFPSAAPEFRKYQSLRTHELDILLEFSGIKRRVNSEYPDAWKFVTKYWGTHWRYLPVGSANAEECSHMIDAVASLLEVI